MDGWTERSTTRDGKTTRWRERPVPGEPGCVEQWFYESDPHGHVEQRSAPTVARTRTATRPRLRVEISSQARADIRRELNENWDGREHAGALAGRIEDGKLVVLRAGGLGVGVATPRGESFVRPSASRFHDFAVLHGLELVGDWHSHPRTLRASDDDVQAWERVRDALRADAYLGLIVLPERVQVRGIATEVEHLRFTATSYVVTPGGCAAITPDFIR
jgi:proteasome lid subunit RPN8/RPN11